MNSQEKLSKHINEWFYYNYNDDTSPALTVCDITTLFTKRLQHYNLLLTIPFKDFRDKLCEATCTMYAAQLENKYVAGPRKISNLPKNWNKNMEIIWEDYMSTFLFNDDFWDDFWNQIPICIWELQFSQFRTFIQNVLTQYVKRSYEFLEDNSLIVQNCDGQYIDINHFEDNDDDDYNYEIN